MATRIAVDVGGTFTDVVFHDNETGEMRVTKTPSTPHAPDEGVIRGVEVIVSPAELAECEYFLHGTTVGLNALLERNGATVALLATEGFRDVLEIRRGDREEIYNLFYKHRPELVPRNLRFPIGGRMRADGVEHRPFKAEHVHAAVAAMREAGVNAVAVAFMNAYANPAHELAAEAALREAGFEGDISLSHRTSGEYREYERTSTTVIDAYVRARMGSYLRRLDQGLRDRGFTGNSVITRSGGGALSFSEAEVRPYETIFSGPVAGAEGAAAIARALDIGEIITADVGGTSFDTCLITDGEPKMLYQGEVVGLPVQTPWIDVRSIGAGGGSIAHVDAGGLLKVGPRSAGAVPGPACYARGGTEPAVTDAAVTLGMMAADGLPGDVALDRDRAITALETVAPELDMTADELARGMVRIASTNMAHAIREITIEAGRDPRAMTLMPFGGAGPIFATLIAQELEVREILVPQQAGNFSAVGLLGTELRRTNARTRIMRVGDGTIEQLDALGHELFGELEARIEDDQLRASAVREAAVDMRFVGQEHCLTIGVGLGAGGLTTDAPGLERDFHAEFGRVFGTVMDDEVEVVALRVTLRNALPELTTGARDADGAAASAPGATHRAWSFTTEQWAQFRLVERERLAAGEQLAGPALLLEPTTTTYVDAGWTCAVDASGVLRLTADA
jgi:N-methylhydantoinase A